MMYIGLLSFFGFIVFLVINIVNRIKKKSNKNSNIGMIVCMVLLITAIALDTRQNSSQTSTAGQNSNRPAQPNVTTDAPIATDTTTESEEENKVEQPNENDDHAENLSEIPEEEDIEIQIPQLLRGDSRDSALSSSVIPIQTDSIDQSGYSVHIIGATFDKSKGDMYQDLLVVGTGLVNTGYDDSFSRGFAFGLKNADSKIANKDAYLTLYIRFEFNDEEISQRDSIIPSLRASGKDDRETGIDFIYYSHEDTYVSLEHPYGIVIFKTFFDSETISLLINNTPYILDVGILKS